RLQPVTGSPFPSGGAAPASVGLKGNMLVVVNKAQDGIRDLETTRPNYTTFKVGPNGSLTPTGSSVSIPLGSSPTQALITSKDGILVSTEEGGPFRAFRIKADGSLKEAANSPLQPPDSIFPPDFPKAKRWGLGIG